MPFPEGRLPSTSLLPKNHIIVKTSFKDICFSDARDNVAPIIPFLRR